ncbi:unnamed protein product [Lactuca virosa]|uniref:RRM domain-containing protein n=1 Tax=Lactuca virosa TaxID=75947 RepID=A0AAU9MT21_9ASTR|nr:unnamed protein product [Lactuca virosa]
MEGCDQNKVFVGGLSWETTEDVLREHFRKYGKVMDAVIAKDRITGTSRGFAFVSFSEASALNELLLNTHTILGRTVEVKKAVPRHEYNQNRLNKKVKTNDVVISNNNIKIKKIFVGGFCMKQIPKDDNGGVGGGNGISNYLSGGNGIGNYFVPVYGGYPYGYYGGFNYGLGPWGYPYHVGVYPSYMNNGYGLMGMGGIMGSMSNGKPIQLSEQHGASSEICR